MKMVDGEVKAEGEFRVLATNDDGIYSDGIRAMVEELLKLAKVSVVAPDRERSATGHAITVLRPLMVEKIDFYGLDVEAWAVDGTPSDCVKLAIEELLVERPQVVVSGINRGPNLGTDVFYSGTVSAAVEGVILGVPSIAVSVAAFENCNYAYAARFAARVVSKIREKGLPPGTLLNINVPSVDEPQIAGVRITRLGTRKYKDVFDKRVDPRGRTYYWLAGDVVECDEGEETDTVAVRNNRISITPIHCDFTRYDLLDPLNDWFSDGER